MQADGRSRARRWTVLGIAFVAVVLFALWTVGKRAMHMQTAAAANSSEQVMNAKAGSELKAVLQLTSVGDGSAEGVVLEKEGENAYRRTNQTMRVSFAKDASVVMGSMNNVSKDAVVHVTGTVGENQLLQLSRIVILTGYVSVH